MPKYRVNGDIYNIPEEKVSAFEKRYPNATVDIYDNDGAEYSLPVSEKVNFQKQFKNWSYTAPAAPSAPSAEKIDSVEQPGPVMPNPDSERNGQDYSLGWKATGSQVVGKADTVPAPQKTVKRPEVEQSQDNEVRTYLEAANRKQVAGLSDDIDVKLNNALTRLNDAGVNEWNEVKKGGLLSKIGYIVSQNSGNPDVPSVRTNPLKPENRQIVSEVNNLEAAKNAMTNARELIEEADKSVNEGNFGGFVKGSLRGFGDKLFDVRTWDMGASDSKDNVALYNALKKFDKGEKLTESEQMLLDAKSVELATNAYFGSYIGRGYKAGMVTAQSLPFMIEMAVNPASATGTSVQSRLAKYALDRFSKKGASRAATILGTKAAGMVGRAVGDAAGAAIMAGTTGAMRVAGDAVDRINGSVETDVDENGRTIFAGHKKGESTGKAIAKAFTSNAIENHSEMLGEYFEPALGRLTKLGKSGMNKIGLGKVTKFIDEVHATDAAKLIDDFQEHTKWNGTIGEYAEEVVGNIENAILVGDSTLDSSDDTGVFNLDQNIDTFLGVALMGGVFSTIRTASWRTPKYRARKEMEKARAKAKKKFGDQEWQDIEDRLAEAGDEGMSSVLSEVIIGERNPEREKAILDYAKSIKIYEGTLKGDEKHRELSSPEMTDLESSYENGYTLATPQEVHDAKIMFEYQQARLQQALGMSSIDIETLMLGNEMGKLTEEQKSVALDYLNAEATFDGVIDRVRDDIDNRISSVNAAIDASTNSDTGKLQPARLVDDRAVHIISGIVRLTPDGTMVDIHNSEDYIIIRDDKTGKIESVSPSQIVGVDAEIDPESEKKAAESQIRGQIGQQKADIIDGVLQFNPGDVYTLTNEQGQSFTVQVAADEQGIVDNGDGTINVILNEDIDANTGLPRISQMSKEQIENMAEATNMARLQQYEQQKLDVDARQYKEDSTGRTPENPFKINDRISFNDVGSGSVKHGIVESELTDDGKYEIAIENDGSIESVSYLSPEDLSNMQAQLVQSVEEQEAPEIEQNPVEIEQPEQPQVSAFERIPKDEQGNPIYEQAETPDLAWDAIVEQTDGDEAMAQTVADGMVADKETALKKIEKAKSKGGATIAEKIAAEKERKAAIEEAKANLAVWKQIAQTARRRKDAEESEKRRIAEEQAAIRKAEEEKLRAEREEAERIKREALNGVPDISDDTPQDARARGYRRVSGHKVDRQEPIPHLQGNDIAVKFSDDVIVPGRVAVIEAETLQPSHIQGTRNPAHFIDESQPKERTDDASVLSARKIVRNIRPEEITSSITAYTGAPTTNVRGEVIQGNNRSDALRLIWEGDKEQSAIYKQYLMDHAADFGLNADEISAMNHPVLVNMLDVDDADAITLGQFVAQDTESGGTERIKPKNAVQKMGADMRTFADMLLASSDDETSFAGLVDRNGDEVLAWMNRRGFITPTQYKSAFDSKGSITAEAKNDLKGIMYQSIFTGGNIRLEEMFNAMPAKAQRAILATAFRDNESPNTERMVKEIQNSIRAYNALSQGEDFANAKNWKEARLAVESWKMQYAMDDVTGESYLPAEKFSNFALHLATMYKGESQSLIQSTFNHLYDLIQGTQEETLFEKPDNTPRTLAQAILETLNFEYDGQQRSNVLAGDSTASQEREQGSTGTPAAGERVEGGEQPADNTGGTENESGSGEVREKIAEEGSKVNTNPSDAQKEAGNYRMGHVKIDGMDVTIENPKGSIRKGRDADGKEWQSEMHNDYGYIRGTKAVDNDHIDIFLSDDPEHGNVYVIDQVDPKTGKFDESKVMYGFSSGQEARDAYLSNYEEGWKGLGKITEVTKEEFKKWIDSSTRKTKPFSEYASVKAAEPQKEKPVQGIEGYSRDEIKGIVADHINDVMRDNDIHAEIIGMDIYGSRNRHDARPDSDLDVVVEYSGDIREDDMFNALNGEEDALSIDGIKVDINPIRKEETGDLQGYMKQSEKYDKEKAEHAKQKGPSVTSETKNNKSGKIEDYGEQISGARKDMLRDLAKSVQNTSLESLISLPFSKAFKKPNLRKAVEEGALRDKDARFAQATIAAFLSTKKPVSGTKDEKRRQRWGQKTNVEKWAEKAYTGIKILQELFDADERVRDKVIEAAIADKYVGIAEAKAQQQRISDLNHREFNGTSYPLNLIALYNEVFDRLGYPAGQNTKIPVGRIVCSSTFDSYSLRGVNGEDWIYPSRSLKSFEDVVDELVYLIKVANADETADHPIENFKIRGINPKVETTGYRVLAAKNLTTAITRGNRFAVDEIFPTREAALKRIEELKATGLECSEPLEKRETVGYEKYQISFAHPITREFIPLEKEYGSKEDAIAAPEAEHEELNRLANEAIAAATKKSGESVEKSYFHITHYYDKGSDGKYHWYYGVALDDKYGPKKTAFNTMPFFLAERLNSREEAQKQIDANKERWESLVKDVVRQRSNFVYFSGDNETRKGEDYRNGKDVTAEEFANKFGFRGVQFGNWANQADRQAALNNAYDSFMDMSKIIGVSPKAMSLNGELGVAFGSRGSGAASAHYEPGEVVINLTKTRGAGSLAHEWWHALDNYFSRAANVKLGYVTSDKRLPMREEMRKAFNDLVDDVENSDYHTRSMDRGSGYWGTRVEETARLFAEWIADEMAKRGELNNFLAGRNDSEDSYARMGYVFYKAIQKLKPEGEMMTFEEFRKTPMALKGFSYPTRAELETLGKDVRNIFGVVQERTDETTGNVALFQMVDKILSDNSPENRLAYEAVSQMLSNAGIPVELLSDQAMREMAINATMLDTVLPEDESSFKGTVISSIDGAKILNNLDKAIDRYNENPDNRPWTFIGDLASALGSSDKDKSSQYATFETKNGQVVTIRVSNHNATVSNFDNAGESNGISIVISRKPNEGMTNDGDAHIVEFFYPDKALNKAEGKPLVEILKSIKQSLYSGEYKDTTGLAQREEVNAKESVEFLREPDGTVYGATVGGKIYLNRERLNPNTPIHEYTHLWFSALEKANPELYKRGVELMKQLPIWEEVKTDPNYANLSGDDAIASECLSRLVGDRGADKLTELAKKAMVRGDIIGTANRISLIEDFKDWLKKFWTWVRDSFAPWTKEEASRVSVDDIQNMVLSDLAKGVNPLVNAREESELKKTNDKFNEQLETFTIETADRYNFNLGRPSSVLLSAGIENKPIRLHGSKVAKKIRKHGFQATALRDLPKAIAHPIAVFDNLGREGNRSILTELKTDNGNVLVSIDLGRGTEVDFNIVSSAFGKNSKGVLGWINGGKMKFVDKEKALNYLHLSAPIAEASDNAELLSAANIVKEFENPIDKERKPEFQFIGEKGAAHMDKVEEATIRLDNLSIARQMEDADKDAKTIKLATGWERGADGKWRYEISDANIKDTIDLGKGISKKRFEEDMLWNSGRLGNVIEAPELFKAYPQLKDIHIETDSIVNDMPSNGEFNANSNRITIHAYRLKYLNSILNHEIQHAIQHIEGFATGGTPEHVEKEFDAAKTEWRARAYAHELEETAKELGGEYNLTEVENALGKEYKELGMEDLLPDKEIRIKGANYFARGYADRSMDEAIKRFHLDESTRSDFNSYVEYMRIAGEVEARNVSARLGMTPEERRRTLALETEDVSRQDQIILNDALNGNSDIRYKHDETGNGNRTSQDIEAAATKLAESLGEKVRIVRDVNEIEHQNKKVQDNQRKSKGWFNTDTREIVVVLPNATGIEDVQATILHEAVGHKGLRELVGDDRFDDFLDKVYAAATKATRLEIVSLARRNHWDFRLATEEYIAGLAENGFAGRENRTLFEKIKDFFRDMLSRAKIALGVNIGDNELRYMLWRTYQMRTSRGILAKAEDISMQQSMKVGNFRNEVPEESSRLRFRNSSNGSCKSLARDIYEEKTRIVDRKGQKTDTANLMRRLKEAYVDSMQSLKYLQDAISEETGKPVEDFENAYLAENSMSSKNKAQTDIYLNRFFNPIKDAIRDLQKEGAEYGDIVRYLMAKHGLERNEVFSKRDAEKAGGVWDGSVRRDYSGLTELTRRETDTVAPRIDEITSRAEDIVRKFEMDHDTDVLWKKINDATKDTLRTSYITGMLTKDNYEMVRSMFRYYIPLRGWSENTASAVYDYLSDARPKTSSIVKAATGRTTISDDPIATIAYMGQSAIIQGNRNMMKQKLLNLALNHKTGLLTVNRQWEVQDPVTGEWLTRNPVIPVDATPEEVADIVSQFETDMKAAEKNGTARISRGKLDTGKHITAYEGQEHVVKVKRGGIEYCIYLNGNPRAAQAVNGMTNPDAVDSWLIRKARVIKNFMARMFTSQNPAFIISNLSRDVIFAGTAVFAKEDSKYTALYTKNIAKALAKGQLIGLVHRFETGRLDDSKDIDRYFGEFIRNGGETGFTQLNTVDDFKRDLNRFAKEMQQGQVMKVSSKVWNGIWDGVEFMNRCAEDATRFSVYMTSRQMGRSVERSISDAKEITVNFNRKGSGGFGARVMNFAYIFFNAAIQALANAGKIFYEHPVKSAVALSTFSAAGFLAPLLAQAIISAFGGDDDAYWDLPEWVRRNNFVFYVPWSDNKFLIIPISQELRPFYALGEVAMSVLMGKEDVFEGLRSVGGSFMDLLPVDFMGNGNNLAVSLTPTVAQPFAQLVANSDYFGKPIYRRNDYNRLDPAWTKAYKGTSSMLINASKWLNEVTGGDDVKRGWIDPVNNPAVIEHLFESYLGGVGKTINKTAKTISMIWNPEMRDIRNVPIVSTFVQESDDERVAGSQLNREYVKAMEEFRETEHTISGYKRKARMGSMEYADKLSDFMNTPEFKKYSKMKGYASSIAKLRTALKKTEELNGDVMDAEYLQEMLRELKQQMLEELKED